MTNYLTDDSGGFGRVKTRIRLVLKPNNIGTVLSQFKP